jgi:hypothetical protein
MTTVKLTAIDGIHPILQAEKVDGGSGLDVVQYTALPGVQVCACTSLLDPACQRHGRERGTRGHDMLPPERLSTTRTHRLGITEPLAACARPSARVDAPSSRLSPRGCAGPVIVPLSRRRRERGDGQCAAQSPPSAQKSPPDAPQNSSAAQIPYLKGSQLEEQLATVIIASWSLWRRTL